MAGATAAPETPAKTAMKNLAVRNNVADLHLRKKLYHMERQKVYSLTDLDKDRLDVNDFLKNLRKCESDDLPVSKL